MAPLGLGVEPMLCQRCDARQPEEANYCMRCGAPLRGGADAPPPFYHEGARRLQDRFDTRRLAGWAENTLRPAFTETDRAFIAGSCLFFLATADAAGRPECSYRGGLPGFVRVGEDGTSLAFPNYDGNGMYKSLGNILVNPHVGLIFIDFERQKRLRVNGVASLHEADPLLAEYPGAQLMVRVRAAQIFPNCPRYIHKMQLVEHSVYVPTCDHTPPVPEWKRRPGVREVLPRDDPARLLPPPA
jgi:predicted pyridoxine 5'-phosphate oxidase superfamily flavin-nucleotide-binding protein